jgi:A/G-specific adenine glycosylase
MKRTIVRNLLAWFAKNGRDLPWRRTRDPYGIWVSEIMLQQTQVKTVLRYWDRWMEALPTIEALANAPQQTIHKLWEGLGYYTRVRNMQRCAWAIQEKHGGKFPRKFEEVLELPGIGRYTAGAICSIVFNQPTAILDGNVTRVLCRLFGVGGDPRQKETNAWLWKLAEELVNEAGNLRRNPDKKQSKIEEEEEKEDEVSYGELNQSLMELGALVCTPRQPLCQECPVIRHCVGNRQGLVEQLPVRVARPTITRRRFLAFVIEKRGKYLVRQRPAGVVNAHLWEFPNIEVNGMKVSASRAARKLLGGTQSKPRRLCRINHSITRYRISMDVFRTSQHSNAGGKVNGRWLKAGELSRLPFSSAHKKIIQQFDL